MTATRSNTLKLGSRRTPLALAQTQQVVKALRRTTPSLDVEIVEIVSDGDVSTDIVFGPGVFVAALRSAILDGRVDAAVHSLKDLPTAPLPGVALAAVPEREDPRDVLVGRDGLGLDLLPDGARIGTSSPRRAAALVALGRDFTVVPIRGSVGRRLAQLDSGEVDAVLLARAGLARLGLIDRITDTVDPGRILPAAGQGALAIECRADDAATFDLLSALDDPQSRATTNAERALLATLEAGCTHPIGALAEAGEGDDGQTELYLRAVVHSADGAQQVRLSTTGPLHDAEGTGRRLATALLAAGADALMESL